MVNAAANPGRHPLADRGHDLYETPAVAVQALLAAEKLPRVVWEPACGRGAIGLVLQAAGHTVYASDLVDRGYGTGGINFLGARKAPPGVKAIVTNPPFKLAQEFVEKALELVPHVVMLARLAFLESERRSHILEPGSGLRTVHVFRNRLPMMNRDGWVGPQSGSAVAYAWFAWERGHVGPAAINRISWKPLPDR